MCTSPTWATALRICQSRSSGRLLCLCLIPALVGGSSLPRASKEQQRSVQACSFAKRHNISGKAQNMHAGGGKTGWTVNRGSLAEMMLYPPQGKFEGRHPTLLGYGTDTHLDKSNFLAPISP
jgi:hypothetical protein